MSNTQVKIEESLIDTGALYTVGVLLDDLFIPVWDFSREDEAEAFRENLEDLLSKLYEQRRSNAACEGRPEVSY